MSSPDSIDLADGHQPKQKPRSEVVPETIAPIVDFDAPVANRNTQRCSGCSAPIDADDHFCPNCGTVHKPLAEIEFLEKPKTKKKKTAENLSCSNCGSEVRYLGSSRSMKCPFCDTTYVAQKPKAHSGRKEPEFVIGFAVNQSEAASILESWFKKSAWYHPSNLAQKKIVDEIKGVYVPFWSFSTLAMSDWQAEIGEYYWESETYTTTDSNGKRVTRTRQVRRTEWLPLSGRHHQYYSGYLVSGSKGLSQKEADAVLPYNMPAAQRYQPYFLAGWFCEEYSRDQREALKTSQQVFNDWEYRNVFAFLPGDTARNLHTQTSFHKTQSDLFLLPLYLMSYTFEDKQYRVLVNGQTGKISGVKPYSRTKIGWAIGGGIIALLLIVLIIFLLSTIS